jgi:hypothetical protein
LWIFCAAFILLNLSQSYQTLALFYCEAAKMKNQLSEPVRTCEEPNELTRLEAQLRVHLRSYVCDFRMIVQDGGVILYGHSRTYYGKQLAQHGVMERSRLPIRANKITVV